MKLSQSTMKDYLAYKAGELCGLQFHAFNIAKTHRSPSSEAMIAGQWFEYKATGQLNYFGEVPEPPRLKGGGLPAPFVRAEEQAEEAKQHLAALGFKVTATGLKADDLERFRIRPGYDLTVDILAEFTGEDFKFKDANGNKKSFTAWLQQRQPGNREFIVDLKFTGGLDTSYGPLAWGHDPSGQRLTGKDSIKLQALHYHWLTGLPFAWLIYSNKPDKEAALLLAEFDREAVSAHAERAGLVREAIMLETELNTWQAVPALSVCRECELAPGCKFAAKAPIAEGVFIGIEI